MYDFVEQVNYVICPSCGERHNAQDIQAENIEEDIQGRDVLTFICPTTLQVARSLVFRGYA